MGVKIYSVLADLVLIFHAGVIAYNLFGLPIIVIGRVFKLRFVYNPWFRYSHLASMGVVLLFALFNEICPLTNWENDLRSLGTTDIEPGETSIQQWLGGIMYYDLPWSIFAFAYGIWFIAILVVLWLIPVQRKL